MMYAYGGSFQGRSHETRGVVCQDSSRFQVIKNGDREFTILVVADGVGSAKNADIGSDIAAETCFEYLIGLQEYDLEDIKESYKRAFQSVTLRSKDDGNPIECYDTTLTVAIHFDDGAVLYGHSGDGGIIAIERSGEYVPITKPQKGPDGESVIPLRFGEKYWEFGKKTEPCSSVLIMTDGLLDICVPSLLRDQSVKVYVPFIRYFADNNILNADEHGIDEISSSRLGYLNSDSCAIITDDRTLLVSIDSSNNPAILLDAYYAEPDWERIRDEWKREAYPHLYQHASGTAAEDILDDLHEQTSVGSNVLNQGSDGCFPRQQQGLDDMCGSNTPEQGGVAVEAKDVITDEKESADGDECSPKRILPMLRFKIRRSEGQK